MVHCVLVCIKTKQCGCAVYQMQLSRGLFLRSGHQGALQRRCRPAHGQRQAVSLSGKHFFTPRLLIWLPGPIISTVPGRWRGVDGKETGK